MAGLCVVSAGVCVKTDDSPYFTRDRSYNYCIFAEVAEVCAFRCGWASDLVSVAQLKGARRLMHV